ncbi:hypothetical protein [Nocardia australiensis]|uniref:hypothetical protein n=1 Tax=Nocardia australiensis TaxID=2887191 RepID=UPI001D156A81|nr:hypothetical protein [Nocardia australiensis]
MQTLIVVTVVVAVLALVAMVVSVASKPPVDRSRWDTDDLEEEWERSDVGRGYSDD